MKNDLEKIGSKVFILFKAKILYIQSSNEVIKEERKSVQHFSFTIKFSFKDNRMIWNPDLDLAFYLLSHCFRKIFLWASLFWRSRCLEGLKVNIETEICRWGSKMYTKLNIYIKQMTSSECPLGRDFIEVALGWVGKAV